MNGLADRIDTPDDRSLGFEVPPPAPRADAEAVRASLLAVQAAQRAARERARRETWRARFWFVVTVGAVVVGIFAFRAHRERRINPVTAAAKPAVQTAAARPATPPDTASVAAAAPLATPRPSSKGAATTPAVPTGTAGTAPTNSQAARAAASALPGTTPAVASARPTVAAGAELSAQATRTAPPLTGSKVGASAISGPELNDPAARPEACDDLYRKQRWKLATVACMRAFELDPTRPELALRVAQSMHARGRAVAAGEWAQRTIALDPQAAEAFVILARAETRAKQPAAAARSYRRYLQLAPRGWHAAEARDAVRAARAARTGDRSDARTRTGDGAPAAEAPAPHGAQASAVDSSKG